MSDSGHSVMTTLERPCGLTPPEDWPGGQRGAGPSPNDPPEGIPRQRLCPQIPWRAGSILFLTIRAFDHREEGKSRAEVSSGKWEEGGGKNSHFLLFFSQLGKERCELV